MGEIFQFLMYPPSNFIFSYHMSSFLKKNNTNIDINSTIIGVMMEIGI